MTPSFNLVDQKWIPCKMLSKSGTELLGLKDALVRAHEIQEIEDSSPLVTVALHRLLLAILHRNFGPSSLADWKKLWNDGKWDSQKLSSYFASCHERFYLFHDRWPFYQVTGMDDAKTHPISLLAFEMSSGNNPTLFDHTIDESFTPISTAQAVRHLIAYQAFAIGFGKSKPFYFSDAPLVRGFTVLVLGNNLFETLALNLLAYNQDRPLPRDGEDVPCWEQARPQVPRQNGNRPSGYVDYLTWQSRRVNLVAGVESNQVQRCQVQQNLKLTDDVPDPLKCYIVDDKTGTRPISLSPEKALWRDSHILLQEVDKSYKRPEVFNWLARIDQLRLWKENASEAAYRLSALGFTTEPGKAGKIILWRHERLPLPLAYLNDAELLGKLKEALDLAEGAGKALRNRVWLVGKLTLFPDRENSTEARTLTKKQMGDVNAFVDGLAPGRSYWPCLESPFKRLLEELPLDKVQEAGAPATYGGTTVPQWAATVRRTVEAVFHATTESMDSLARTLKAVAVAERQLHYDLAKILGGYNIRDERR